MLLASAMAATLLAGCGAGGKSSSKGDSDGEIKEFTAFFAVPGSEINDDNEVQQIIAENRRKGKRNLADGSDGC